MLLLLLLLMITYNKWRSGEVRIALRDELGDTIPSVVVADEGEFLRGGQRAGREKADWWAA